MTDMPTKAALAETESDLRDMMEICNSALNVVINRSSDLQLNPLWTMLTAKILLETNIQDYKDTMSTIEFEINLPYIPADVQAEVDDDDPYVRLENTLKMLVSTQIEARK